LRALALLLRGGLGALLLYAGAVKLGDPGAFALEIANYRFFPSLAPYLAVTLPTVEMAVGLGLLVLPAAWRRASALAALLLFGVFTVAVAQVVARGLNVSCGCFGGNSGPVTPLTLARDLVLLGAAGLLLRISASAPRP
jgi:hypothetical protein